MPRIKYSLHLRREEQKSVGDNQRTNAVGQSDLPEKLLHFSSSSSFSIVLLLVTIILVVNARSSSEDSGDAKLCEQLTRRNFPSEAFRRHRVCDEEQEEETSEDNDKRKRNNEGRALHKRLEHKRLATRFLQKRMS